MPVLCRKDPCVEGIVKNKENGYQYETFEEFSEACLKVTGDADWKNFLSAGAVRTGLDFGARQFGDKVCAVYQAALAGRRSRIRIGFKGSVAS